MNAFLDVAEIVKRAKQIMSIRTDNEFADYMGVSRATVSNWRTRNSIDFPLLMEKFKEIDYNWLLTGNKKPHKQSRSYDNGLARGEVGVVHNPKTPDVMDNRNILLYDIAAAANLKALLANKNQYIVGKIQIPSIPVCDGALFVSGDSMYPILKSGDIVGFKEINSFGNVVYGEIYLVSFMIDSDEYLAVKFVNHSEKENCLKLVSYNTHHEPMDISFDTINAMAIVKFSIRKNMMM